MQITEFLNKLAEEIHQGNRERGFWDEPRNVGEMIALVHSELSEGLEAHRGDVMDDKLPQFQGLTVELADAVIRILDMAAGLGLDIGAALAAKLQYNSTRGHKHGKKY